MGSGFHDFASGEVLTANNVDGYLMRQTVMTFATSAARDSDLSGVLDEGMVAYLEDNDQLTYYNGSGWRVIYQAKTAWTPTFTNLTVGNGTLAGEYARFGELVHVSFELTWGSTTSISGSVSISNLPVNAATAVPTIGQGLWTDSGTTVRAGFLLITGAASAALHSDQNVVNSTNPFTWTTGDVMRGSMDYRVSG